MQKSWLGCNIIIEKSVVACAVYHSFIDAIGAVYDWNLLFDSFPGSISTNVYRGIWLIAAVVLWFTAEKNGS